MQDQPMTSSTSRGVSRRSFLGAVGSRRRCRRRGGLGRHLGRRAALPRRVRSPGRAANRTSWSSSADDLGWGDLSCYGAPTIRTPHLDRLAASGVRFTDGYSASSVCSPTRFGLYTGRYPGRLHGGLAEPIGSPTPVDGIPLDHPTLASLLKGAGYDTAMLGKWHCGYLPWFSPTRLGWDEFFGNFSGGLDYFSKSTPNGDYDLYEGEVEHQDLRYYTHVLTERATEFVRASTSGRGCSTSTSRPRTGRGRAPADQAVSRDLTRRIHDGEERGPRTPGRGVPGRLQRDGRGPRRCRGAGPRCH